MKRRDFVAGIGVLAGSSLLPCATARSATTEILIRGGRVVNADRVRGADVRIVGETIVEVGADLVPGPGARIIEAKGRLVMPGGIDPHTHFGGRFVDDITDGSRAALAGGITTLGTFATTQPSEPIKDAIERHSGYVRQQAIADIFLHGQTWPPNPEAMSVLAALGQPSFKIFPQPDFETHIDALLRMLESARAAGVVSLIHCEDGRLVAAARRRLQAAGRTSLQAYAESRPAIAELAATQRAAGFCESTGAPMYVVHLSLSRALDVCRTARAAGLPLFVETRPLYLFLTEERLHGPEGPLYVGNPPLRSASDVAALWGGLIDGSIDVLATDHAPSTRAMKLDPALSITNTRAGVSDLQFMLPMYFSEGTGKRGLPLERFVATTSTNAARIFGLYPRKGVIQAGSDADLAIWDPAVVAKATALGGFSKSDYTVYEGTNVTGWPVMTIRRGQVVFENGRVTGQPGSGRLLSREPWHPQNKR